MEATLYSIRMHASREGGHLSGAEKLAPAAELERLAAVMVHRALNHPRGVADAIRLTVELLPEARLRRGRLPDLRTLTVADWREGRRAALHFLGVAGVAEAAARCALEALATGPAPGGGSMRGAMLVDAASGERLEPDQARGVRASRMDLSADAERQLRHGLAELGLDNDHVCEALVLAAKVLSAPGIVAELCWSDDPDYTAGYVAAPSLGYLRFTHLKPLGDPRGGRAFFVHRPGLQLATLIAFLETTPLLFDAVGDLHPATEWED